jgi:carboxyl-terminal processing protease
MNANFSKERVSYIDGTALVATNMNQISQSLRILRSFALGGLVTTSIVLLPRHPGCSTPKILVGDSPKAIVDEVWQIVNDSYVDGTFHHTDWKATRQKLLSKNYTSKAQAYDAIRVALKTLDDPYTRFLDPQSFADLNTQTSGELSGIGAKLGVDKATKALTIVGTIDDSPALKAGLKSGDKILAIDGKSTRNLDTAKAASLIRGKANTVVKLKISRPGQKQFDVAITRQLIQVSSVTSSVKKEGNHRIGYIRLAEFDAHSDEGMRKAILSLNKQKVDGYILDLRDNPGGLLTAAIGISRLWLNTGDIVRTVDRDEHDEKIAADNSAITQLPLTVLVDSGSASSSEILTGALKDNKRAIVVGTKTFGKALVQRVNPLSDGSGVNVTIAKYFTPNGVDINHKGILPDVPITLTKEQIKKISENPKLLASSSDPQYVQAVKSLTKQIQASRGTPEKSSVSTAPTQPESK